MRALFAALSISLLGSSVHALRVFKYRSYSEITALFNGLAQSHPQYIKVETAQAKYGLQSTGSCGPVPCEHLIARITNFNTLPSDNGSRPQVFFSGALHGNEQVGPNTVSELALLLVNNAAAFDAGSKFNPWLLHLLNTRDITIIPMTNSIGYYNNVREENGIDPNRDFPYWDATGDCMNTIAARAVNEVWRDNLFQLSLTYHGGMQAIAWEWGAPNHNPPLTESPDDAAQSGICNTMSVFAGRFQGDVYPVGRLNDLVYAVDGGMEDWGYGSSWENKFFPNTARPCTPTNTMYKPYPKEKTQYSTDMLRTFNILIETSDLKKPNENTLGSDAQILKAAGTGDGHLPRNIRLALLIADVVQPYIKWTMPSMVITNSFSSFKTQGGTDFIKNLESAYPTVPHYTLQFAKGVDTVASLTFTWEVAGGLTVDKTQLHYGPFPSMDKVSSAMIRCNNAFESGCSGPEMGYLDSLDLQTTPAATNVHTRWSDTVKVNSDMDATPFIETKSFTIAFPTDNISTSSDFIVIATATVDGSWVTQSNPQPAVPPQSHIVNGRTNLQWSVSNNGKIIKGRTVWYSWPVRVRVVAGASQSTTPTTLEPPSSNNNDNGGGSKSDGGNTGSKDAASSSPAGTYALIVFLSIAIPVGLAYGVLVLRGRQVRAGLRSLSEENSLVV